MQADEIYVTPLGFGIRIDGKDSGYLFPSRETAEAYVPTLLRNRLCWRCLAFWVKYRANLCVK